MKIKASKWLTERAARAALTLLAMGLGSVLLTGCEQQPAAAPPGASKPSLSVKLTRPQSENWPQRLAATGNVAAWQEAVIGPEIANYRIAEVRAQVGEQVAKGQILARIANDTVASELAEAKASVAELEATVGEAKGNAERARELRAKGFYSNQLNSQYQTAEQTAAARLAAARARLQAAELRMAKTNITAPDAGIISARSATVGSLTQTGQELFRLIRGGRLEWRAEVPSAQLARIQVGLPATVSGPDGRSATGKVRIVSPSVDPQTRNGLVYVDLPAGDAVRAGMFARGEFELGQAPALTLPQSAVVLREGFAYVFRIEKAEGELQRIAQTKVSLGRRLGERVEIVDGLAADASVVESGVGFLADGDAVKVVSQ